MSRKAFTLIELIVSTAIAGVLAAVVVTGLVRQQRFYASANEQREQRERIRDATAVLTSDIRGAAVAELGVPLMTDTAVELFSTIATSVVCSLLSPTVVGLPPQTLSSGNTLTSSLALPDTGDIALMYGAPYGFPDSGGWEHHRISGVTVRPASIMCPPAAGFTTPADVAAGVTSWQLSVAIPSGSRIRRGSPVHFARRGRYSLYRSSDGAWYLGYRRCNADGPSVCGSIQPLSGPYHSYSTTGSASGIELRYFSSSGSRISSTQSSSLARIDIVMRSEPGEHSGPGEGGGARIDSAVAVVSPRNRAR